MIEPVAHVRAGEVGETQYVRSGEGHVAYQVLSTGPIDILVVNEKLMPIEALHDNVFTESFLGRLAAWGRVILFDRRGVGLSDAVAGGDGLQLADWVDDAVCVLDAVGSTQAALVSSGPSAGLIALQLAADHPDRVSFLSLYDAVARYRWAPDYPFGVTSGVEDVIAERSRTEWGTPRFNDRRGRFAATAARHPGFVDWATTWLRRGAGPATNAAHALVLRTGDLRAALGQISCPTLVINHVDVEDGRYLAEHIAGARYVELHDPCHLMFSPELDEVMAVTNEMLNGSPIEPARQRVLTTLLFTDIVDSTSSVSEVGDRRWGLELDVHYDMLRRHVERFDGREIKTTGDGFIATFDGPTRAVQCALAIRDEAGHRHVIVRAGVHTGEVEMRGGDVLGVSVHVAQRMCALAASGQVLVSKSVVDLAAGSELRFEQFGEHHLKGLPGRWSVFAASTPLQRPRDVGAAAAGGAAGRVEDLSRREREVLDVLGTGASNAEIAATLFMSEATVKAHVSHLFTKVGCTNRVQLALFAHRIGSADA